MQYAKVLRQNGVGYDELHSLTERRLIESESAREGIEGNVHMKCARGRLFLCAFVRGRMDGHARDVCWAASDICEAFPGECVLVLLSS